ncbi:MAG: hypothetical protein LBQ12_14055 [Deltaproteobacteria bacterium]|nr:hypothetical protein [Deltaproteobacteria bacterium]
MKPKYLVVEGISDCFYLAAISLLVATGAEKRPLNDYVAWFPANSADNIKNCVLTLKSSGIEAAALFNSDPGGNKASEQKDVVMLLGAKKILRTRDFYFGSVKHVEMEEFLRETLVAVAKDKLKLDVTVAAKVNKKMPIAQIIMNKSKNQFKKQNIGDAFARWAQTRKLSDLTDAEQKTCISLMKAVKKAFQ